MGEIVVITSGKGGVGKTTTTANVGCLLARLGKTAILVDADIGLRNLDVITGTEDKVVYDLVDVVKGKCRLSQATLKVSGIDGLFVLAASQTREKNEVSPEEMILLARELRTQYDFVLIDCPAGIEQGFQNAIAGADKAILVTTPEAAAVRDADKVLEKLSRMREMPKLLVINRVRPHLARQGYVPSTAEIIETLAIDLLGIVPEEEAVLIANHKGTFCALDEKSIAGAAFMRVAKRLTGERVAFHGWKEKKSFRAKRRLKRAKKTDF